MKNCIKRFLRLILPFIDLLYLISVIILTLVMVLLFSYYQCKDVTLCYTILVFLASISISLKLKILDYDKDYEPYFFENYKIIKNNRFLKKELIIFEILFAVNVLFIFISYFSSVRFLHVASLSMLNFIIMIDFFSLIRNSTIIIQIYKKNVKDSQKNKNVVKNIKLYNKKDLFSKWLKKKSIWITRALTDKSYKDIYREEYKEELDDRETNFELATFGDSILKMGLMEILRNKNVGKITEEKKKYESDRSLVMYIAKYYQILDVLQYNKNIKNINDYDYDKYYKNSSKKKENSSKFIATAVEAVIGAIYEETKSIKKLIKLFNKWIDLIDSEESKTNQESISENR